MTDQNFSDLVNQYMTDYEKYEIELLNTDDAIKHFIAVFGRARWGEICKA